MAKSKTTIRKSGYESLFPQLEIKTRERRNDCWGTKIGIDEHTWRKRHNSKRCTDFASLIVDHDRGRIAEVVNGKTAADLRGQLSYIPGRERVEEVTIDMCDPFKKFVKDFFPNAKITADKFHVLRLITPHINRARMELTGDKRSNPVRKLLLRNRHQLKYFDILKQNNDGFIISEEDMKIRGFGDILGFKQSGIKNFKLADPVHNSDLFLLAEKEMRRIENSNEDISKFKPLIKLYDRADIINDIA